MREIKKIKNPKVERKRVKGFIIYIERSCCDRYGDKVLGEEVRKSGFCLERFPEFFPLSVEGFLPSLFFSFFFFFFFF